MRRTRRRATARRFDRTQSKYKSRWEEEYAARLEAQKQAGLIKDWQYEQIRIRLADGKFYTPDFMVLCLDDEVQLHEVKGRWREAAAVRTAVALEKVPFAFFIVRRQSTGRGSKKVVTWTVEEMD